MFRHHPFRNSAIKAYNSVSAELKHNDCCVLDQTERVAFPHCVPPPLVLFHVCCCPAQSLSVYTFTNGGNLLISIKHFALGTPFNFLATRFTFISSLSVGQMISLAVSFTLYMMSARSWHMYNNFPTAVLYIARFSFSSLTNDSVVGVNDTFRVAKHGNQSLDCNLDLLLPSFREPFSRSLCQEETRFYHPIAPLVPQCAS